MNFLSLSLYILALQIINFTQNKLYRRIKNVDVDFPDYFSSQGRKFCKSLLQKVPGDRLKLTEFTKQTWLKHYLKKRKTKEIFNLPL